MKPENLENLLYCYIEGKTSHDVVDSPVAQACVQGGYDTPFVFPNLSGDGYSSVPQLSPQSAVMFQYDSLNNEQRNQVSAMGKKLVEMTTEFFASQPDRCPVKFKSCCLFVSSNQQTISIPIIRLPGTEDIPLKISWKTRDRTAVSGTHYVSSSGAFELGKDMMGNDIQINILPFKTDAKDLRFQVELSVENSVFIPKSMTVTIQNVENLYDDERNVVESLLRLSPSTVADVVYVLRDSLTNRTFHTALSYLCSKADSLPLEFGLAFELSQHCLQRLRPENVLSVLIDFFRMDDLNF